MKVNPPSPAPGRLEQSFTMSYFQGHIFTKVSNNPVVSNRKIGKRGYIVHPFNRLFSKDNLIGWKNFVIMQRKFSCFLQLRKIV